MSASLDPLEPSRLTISYVADQVVVGVRGEIDLLTAPELAAVMTSVIDRGHLSVVVDLAETTFMGVAGLRIIEAATDRLGKGFSVRAPSAQIRRLLDITGLAESVHVDHLDDVDVVEVEDGEGAEDMGDGLGPEQTESVPGTPVTVEPADLARRLRLVSAIPADHDVVDGALRLLVALTRAAVEAADGVSVSLHRHGRLTTVASSDQTILDIDADQYATGQGPCMDAAVKGRWIHVESLDQETRWPAFTTKARQRGISGAMLSTPLLAEDRPVGALNIYSHATEAFAAKDQDLASILATEASTILRDAGLDVPDDELANQLPDALRTRQTIAQAQGVLMERHGISEQDAYTQLRSFSQRTNQPLGQRATHIVASTQPGCRVSPARPEEAL